MNIRGIVWDFKNWCRRRFKKNCCDCQYYEWVGAAGLIEDGKCLFNTYRDAKYTRTSSIEKCGPGFWCCHFRRKP